MHHDQALIDGLMEAGSQPLSPSRIRRRYSSAFFPAGKRPRPRHFSGGSLADFFHATSKPFSGLPNGCEFASQNPTLRVAGPDEEVISALTLEPRRLA